VYALVLLAQLVTQAPAGRPPECGVADAARAANVWERAKSPELRPYCDLLASGASKLASGAGGAEQALRAAEEAGRRMPGKLAPLVLQGRALSRLGRHEEAWAVLDTARKRDAATLDDPWALLALARSAARTRRVAEADEAYRALLPRAAALPGAERGPVYVEAALVAMARGPSAIDAAIAIFRQARREAQDSAQTVAWLGLALALDRAGEREEARALLSERGRTDPRPQLADARARDLVAAPLAGELDAAAALALEAIDPAASRELWKRVAAAGGPWAEHAQAQLAPAAGRGKRAR
jgi:tetratricopeptide (TPR) repeat protein